jgi:pilus assembly protein Flp/PilA
MKAKILGFIERLRRDASGATAIEYGLIAAGIAVVIIGAIALAGGALTNTFNSIAAAL